MEVFLIRYVPEFILHQWSLGKLRGSFKGFVLLLDIVDFTGVMKELQSEWQQGADKAGKLLNIIFDAPIKAIHRHHGFVNLFIGDALCAVFIGENPDNLIAAIREIDASSPTAKDLGSVSNRLHIALHRAISFGEISWEIFQTDFQHEYLFMGKPFIEVSETISYHSEINRNTAVQTILDKECQKSVGTKLSQITNNVPSPLKTELAGALNALFIHKRFSTLAPANEIRAIVPCFVKLDINSDISAALHQIHLLADRFHGYVNKMEHSKEGIVILIIFGAPLSDGKSIWQGGSFSIAAVNSIPGIAIGFSCGFAYTGYIGARELREYTGLGNSMNIASRLMSMAQNAEILCDRSAWQELHENYHFQALGQIRLKGVDQIMPYYRLLQENKSSMPIFKHGFVGRQKELQLIAYAINESIAHQQSRILYISGEPGQGKSRLAFECLKNFEHFRQIAVYCQQDSHLAFPPFF